MVLRISSSSMVGTSSFKLLLAGMSLPRILPRKMQNFKVREENSPVGYAVTMFPLDEEAEDTSVLPGVDFLDLKMFFIDVKIRFNIICVRLHHGIGLGVWP